MNGESGFRWIAPSKHFCSVPCSCKSMALKLRLSYEYGLGVRWTSMDPKQWVVAMQRPSQMWKVRNRSRVGNGHISMHEPRYVLSLTHRARFFNISTGEPIPFCTQLARRVCPTDRTATMYVPLPCLSFLLTGSRVLLGVRKAARGRRSIFVVQSRLDLD
jgi:hypothetical protein